MRDVVRSTRRDFVDLNLLDNEPSSIIFCNFGVANSLDYNLAKSNSGLIVSLTDIVERYNREHNRA